LAAESTSAATDAALHAGPGIVFAGGVVRVGGYAVALVGGGEGGMGVAYRLPLGRAWWGETCNGDSASGGH
jgi:hypothetical protein